MPIDFSLLINLLERWALQNCVDAVILLVENVSKEVGDGQGDLPLVHHISGLTRNAVVETDGREFEELHGVNCFPHEENGKEFCAIRLRLGVEEGAGKEEGAASPPARWLTTCSSN